MIQGHQHPLITRVSAPALSRPDRPAGRFFIFRGEICHTWQE